MEDKKQSIKDAYQNFKENPELNKDKLLSCLQNMREAWVNERKSTKDQDFRNQIAFYSGNQYIRDSGNPAKGYRVRLKENHTNNNLNRMISIFVQNMPIVRVFPSSIQHEDISNAEATEFYGKYIWRIKKMEQLLAKYLKYAAIFGNGLTWRRYDPFLNGKLAIDPSETESGKAEIRDWRGDSRISVLDPFKFAPRPGIEEMDDMYDCFIDEPVNRQDLESKYGKIDADPATVLNAKTGQTRKDNDMVVQHHYYHKPTPWFEEGLYVCWAGKTLVKARDSSECEKVLPVTHLPFDKVPLSFWAGAPIDQVMDLQEQLNRASSMIIEARNLMARPRFFVSNEAKMPAQSITDRPGDIFRFAKEGGEPKPLVANFNFAELAAHKTDIRNALSAVLGMSSASRGEIPQATRTALALQLVLEQDRSQYLPFIKSFHQSILDAFQGLFEIAAEYIHEEDPRVVKIEGVQGSKLFHGGMVPSPLDMYLEDTNPLGWTAAGRIEQVGNLIDRKVITDRNQILEMLKLNSTDPVFELKRINQQAALKEIDLLNKAQPVDIGSEDDDPVHLEEHVKVIAGFNFRNLPKPVQDVHLAHTQKHKDRLQAVMGGGAPPKDPATAALGPKMAQGAESLLSAPETGQNFESLLSR